MLLERPALDVILKCAGEAYPDECCGAMVGTGRDAVRSVREAWPIENTAPSPGRRYVVAPEDYRRVERRAREAGVELVGFYHSHPDAPAAPSAFDLAHAFPGFSYVIISVGAQGPGAITSWRLRDDRSTFDSEEVTWQPES